MFATRVRSVPEAVRGRSPRRPSARRPRLEALEGRCTPSSVGPSGYVLTDLGILPGYTSSYASGVNDLGQVVGYSQINSTGAAHAFLYNDGAMIDLGTLGGQDSTAVAINNRGQVVGYSQIDSIGTAHAFLYNRGAMKDLGALFGTSEPPPSGTGVYSFATAINDRGQVVGWSRAWSPTHEPTTHAFLYDHGTMTDLNSLIPTDSGFTVTVASDINERGQIAASGVDLAGNTHALLLTPSGPCFTATTVEFHCHHG